MATIKEKSKKQLYSNLSKKLSLDALYLCMLYFMLPILILSFLFYVNILLNYFEDIVSYIFRVCDVIQISKVFVGVLILTNYFFLLLLSIIIPIISILIFSYNLYYLKTEKETLAIYGMFEILFSLLCVIVFCFGELFPNEPLDLTSLFLKKMILIYASVYIIVRGFENIGKRYQGSEASFYCFKFGTNEQGKVTYYTKSLLVVALSFEKRIKKTNQRLNKEVS